MSLNNVSVISGIFYTISHVIASAAEAYSEQWTIAPNFSGARSVGRDIHFPVL